MIIRRLNKKGFTLLELLIATMVFSIILLGATAALLQLGRMYYKGVVTNKTQEITRQVADEIIQQVQFGGNNIAIGTPVTYGGGLSARAFCIGNQRYTYAINARVDSNADVGQFNTETRASRHALWRDTVPNNDACVPVDLTQADPSTQSGSGVTVGTNGRELLDQNMRLTKDFTFGCNIFNGICDLTVSILYGANDLLTPADDPTACANVVGSHWCAASSVSTQITKRLRQSGT